MSQQTVPSDQVAAMQSLALRYLHGRGLRGPARELFPDMPIADRLAVVSAIVPESLSTKSLAACSAALAAVRNYYREIGARWDAERFDDMLIAVDARLDIAARHDSAWSAESWQSARDWAAIASRIPVARCWAYGGDGHV